MADRRAKDLTGLLSNGQRLSCEQCVKVTLATLFWKIAVPGIGVAWDHGLGEGRAVRPCGRADPKIGPTRSVRDDLSAA